MIPRILVGVIKVFGRIHLLAGLLVLLSLIRPLVIPVHARTSAPPVGFSPDQFLYQEESPTPEPVVLNPADVINAVNNLRLSNGLNALAVHPVLMDVAAEQANALAATEGAIGHERPCGVALGQYLLMKGFPLWGDLSLDGYRSENWVAAGTIEEVMTFWSGDAEHLNTMMSPNRSSIGAAVAVSEQYYVVLETALQTSSGQHQSTAYDILTGIPATQAACMGAVSLNSDGSISQYSVPVGISTARLDGDVVHEVQYGQTLWSLAIEYGTTIEQIKRYNNLTTDAIAPGWKLLIQKSATQPAAAPPTSITLLSTPTSHSFPTPTIGITPTDTPASNNITAFAEMGQNQYIVAALIVSFSVLVAGIVGFGRKRES